MEDTRIDKLAEKPVYVNVALFAAVFAIICFKSVVILGFLANGDPSDYDLLDGFSSIPSVPVFLSFIGGSMALMFLFKGSRQVWFLVAYDLFFSLLFEADIMKYRAYASFMTPFMLVQLGNLENLGDCLISMLRSPDIIFVIDIPLIALGTYFLRGFTENAPRNLPVFLGILFFSGAFLAYSNNPGFNEGPDFRPIFEVSWLPSKNFKELSPIGYHLFDSYMFFYETRTLNLGDDEEDYIKQWYVTNLENLPDNRYKGICSGKNLIFVNVESLENFVINKEIDGQEITPNLNRMLANSLYFPRIVEQVSEGLSSDSYLLVNTSVYPVRTGATFFRYPNNTYNSLPVLLNKQGYSSIAFHPVRGSYWNWMPASKAIGFKKCLDSTNWECFESFGLGISDGAYLPQVAKCLSVEEQPFYAFIVTLSTHAPFNLPGEHRELNLPDYVENSKLGDYLQSVHYTDEHLGLFLADLESRGILANSVVVICGDHCGVHSFYNDEVQKVEPAQDWWLDNHNRIPLIIYGPDLPGENIDINGGQIDILPTLAYLMGVEEDDYQYTAMGRNLLKTTRDYAVVSHEICYGDTSSPELVAHAVQGLEIADLLIRSDYFSLKEHHGQP